MAVKEAKFEPRKIPLIVELAKSALFTKLQVPAPKAEIERINLVSPQVVPVYPDVNPSEPVRTRVEVMLVKIVELLKVEVELKVVPPVKVNPFVNIPEEAKVINPGLVKDKITEPVATSWDKGELAVIKLTPSIVPVAPLKL